MIPIIDEEPEAQRWERFAQDTQVVKKRTGIWYSEPLSLSY